MVEWSERLGYGADGCWLHGSGHMATGNCVNPEVNQ